MALVQWIMWRCYLRSGTGDAGVGPGACRIEMYLYTLYLGVDIVRAKMIIAGVGAGEQAGRVSATVRYYRL